MSRGDKVETLKLARVEMPPNADVVRLLERLLGEAQAGALRAVGVAKVYRDDLKVGGSADHSWAGEDTWALDRAIRGMVYCWDRSQFEKLV